MTLREEPHFMTLHEKPYFMTLREEPQSHVSCSLPFAFADLRPPTSALAEPMILPISNVDNTCVTRDYNAFIQ